MTEQRLQEILLGLVGGSQLEIINEGRERPITAEEVKLFRIIVGDVISETYGIQN